MSVQNISENAPDRIECTSALFHLMKLEEKTMSPSQWRVEDFHVVSDETPQYAGCFVNKSTKVKFQVFLRATPVVENSWQCKVWNDRSNLSPRDLEDYETLQNAFKLVQRCYTLDASAQKWIPSGNVLPHEEDILAGSRLIRFAAKILRAFSHKMDNSYGQEFMVDIIQRCIELCHFGPYIYVKNVGTSPHSKDGGIVVPLKKEDLKSSSQSSHMDFSPSTSSADDYSNSGSSLPVSSDDEYLGSASGLMMSSERTKKKSLNPPSRAKYKARSDLQVHSDIQVLTCYPNDDYTCQMVVEIKSGSFKTTYITQIVKNMLINIEDRDEIFGILVYATGTHLFRLYINKDRSTSDEKILNLAIENRLFAALDIASCLMTLCQDISAIINHFHKPLPLQA